jgi:hypothetical protein
MPPTCTPNERKFLDRIKEIGAWIDPEDTSTFGEIDLPNGYIELMDFPDINLKELVE